MNEIGCWITALCLATSACSENYSVEREECYAEISTDRNFEAEFQLEDAEIAFWKLIEMYESDRLISLPKGRDEKYRIHYYCDNDNYIKEIIGTDVKFEAIDVLEFDEYKQ